MILISTIEELQLIGVDVNYPDSEDYVLQNDIDASITSTWNGGEGFVPIPTFTGTFDGDGHTISNIVIKPLTYYNGVFKTATSATISNLNVTNADIGDNRRCAVLVGLAYETTSITNCNVSAALLGDGAGIAVNIYDTVSIIDCSATVVITSGSTTSGLVMNCNGANVISGCTVNVTATGIISVFGGITTWFEGDGSVTNCNVIIDITMSSGVNCGGFIGSLRGNVTISNCNVSGTYIVNGSMNTFGAFIGYVDDGVITNCTADVVTVLDTGIQNNNNLGGFIGHVNGISAPFTDCTSSGSITVTGNRIFNVGGFVGSFVGGFLEDCSTSVEISIDVVQQVQYCGGFIGYCDNANFTRCLSTGNITLLPYGDSIGGFIGFISGGNISQCYSTGNVTCNVNFGGNFNYGGFVGYSFATILNCYSRGNVAGGLYTGGFVGKTFLGSSTNCYSSGSVSGYGANVGGFTADGAGSYVSCYWDTETSGQPTSFGGIGKTTVEMKTEATFVDWVFNSTWFMVEDETYPSFYPSVIYYGNGNDTGTAPALETHQEGTTVTISLNTGFLEKTGFVFTGWNTQTDGSGTHYDAGSTFVMPLSHVTLYAEWKIPYSVSYDGNGNDGGTVPASANYFTGETVIVLGNTGLLEKTGNIFIGWNTQLDGEGTHYNPNSTFLMPSNDVTLYAEWVLYEFFDDIYPILIWMSVEKCEIISPSLSSTYYHSPVNVTIEATATSYFGDISYVEFFSNGIKIGQVDYEPYNLNVENIVAGTYTIIARATNDFGAYLDSTPITIEIIDLQVSCIITYPVNNQVFTNVPLSIIIEANASASPVGDIEKVEFFVDDIFISESLNSPYTSSVLSGLLDGFHVLTAIATTTSEYESISVESAAITIEVKSENTVPVCWIEFPDPYISPPTGNIFARGSDILLKAVASDTDGTVVKVQFFVDDGTGPVYVGESLNSPFNFVLENVLIGTYVITAIATDNQGGQSVPLESGHPLLHIEVVDFTLRNTDTIPPITTSNISFCSSWNRRPGSIVELTAIDYANTEHDIPSGVNRTRYTIDGTTPTLGDVVMPLPIGNELVTSFYVVGQGEIPITFFSVDNNGNAEQIKLDYLRLDNIPPVTTYSTNIPSDGSNGWFKTNPIITLSASDASSGVLRTWYRFNSDVFQEYVSTFTLPGEGIYTLQYFSEDNADNVEDVKTSFVKYDSLPPETQDDILPILYREPKTVYFFTSDLHSGVENTYFTLDGTTPTVSSTSGTSVTIVETGTYTVKYFSVDFAGNQETVKTKQLRIFIDEDGPGVYIYENIHINGQNGWYISTPQISITAVDPSGIKDILYKLSPVNVTTTAKYTSTVDISSTVNLSENQFIRIEIDQSGEILEIDVKGIIPSQTTISEIINAINAITGDIVASETNSVGEVGNGYITMTSPTAGTANPLSEIKFLQVLSSNATELIFGLDDTQYPYIFTETVVFRSYEGPFIIPSDNYWNVDFYAIDNQDNESEIQSKRYKLDSEKPITTVYNDIEPDGDNGWYRLVVPGITLNASDNLSGVELTYYRWDGACWQEYTEGTIIEIPSQGEHYLEIYSLDVAGNEEDHQFILYKYDNTSPETTDDTINYQGIIFTAKGSGHQQVIEENPEIIDPYHLKVRNYNVVAAPYIYNVTKTRYYVLEDILGDNRDILEVLPLIKDENPTRISDYNFQLTGLGSSLLQNLDDVIRVYNKTKGFLYALDYDNSFLYGNLTIATVPIEKSIDLGDVLEVDYKFQGLPISFDDIIDVSYSFDLSHEPHVLSTTQYILIDSQSDIAGTVVVNGTVAAGLSTLIIDGFTHATGTVTKGTRFTITGHTCDYTVIANSTKQYSEATVVITPVLEAEATDGDSIIFQTSPYVVDHDVTIHLFPTDAFSSIAHTYYTTDGSEPTINSLEGTVFELTEPGLYPIKYFSIDAAGNVEDVKKSRYNIIIDKRIPDLDVVFDLDLLEDGENGWFKYNFGLDISLWSGDRLSRQNEDVVESITHKIVTGVNDTIDFNEGSGELSIIIAEGVYTTLDLATEIETSLNLTGSFTYFVDVIDSSVSEGQAFTIRTSLSNTFDLLWQSGTNSTRAIGSTLGYYPSTSPIDFSGSDSYTTTYYKFRLNNYFIKSVEQVKTSLPTVPDYKTKQFRFVEILPGVNGFYDEILIEGPIALPSIINVTETLDINSVNNSAVLANLPISGTLVVTENSIPLVEDVDYDYTRDGGNGGTVEIFSPTNNLYVAYYSLKNKVLIDYTHYIGLEKAQFGLESTNLSTEVQIYNDPDKFVGINTSKDRVEFQITFNPTPGQFYLEDGIKTIYAKAYDNNTVLSTGVPQKTSIIRDYFFKLDRVAPITTDDIPIDSWLKAPVIITLYPTDALPSSGIVSTFYTIDGLVPTRSSTIGEVIQLSSSGVYDIQYFSLDTAGNSEPVKTALNLVRVDAEPPITVMIINPTSPDGDNWWYITQPEISFTVTDSYSGVSQTFYKINDGVFEEYITPFLLPIEGTVIITYYSIDNVGNIESEKFSVIKYDITAPVTVTDAPLSGYTSSTIINFIVDDTSSGVETTYYTTDGTDPDFSSLHGNFIEIESSGDYELKFFSVDNAGNVETIKTQTVQVDLEKPEITEFLPTDCIITDLTTEISFKVSDTLSGVDIDTVEVDVDGVIYSTQKNTLFFSYTGTMYEYEVTISPISSILNFQDVELLKVKNVTDFAGNVAPTLEFNLTQPDVLSPWIREIYPAPNMQDVSTNSNIITFIDDVQSGVDIKSVIIGINNIEFKINSKNILTIQYTGTASSATLQIINKSLNTYVNSIKDISMSFYETQYNTIKKLQLYIDSLPNYTATIIDERYEQSESTLLLNVLNLNILQSNIVDLYLPEENLNFSFIERGNGYLIFASPSFGFEHKVQVNVTINATDNFNNKMEEFAYSFSPHIYATPSVKKRNYLNRVALEYLSDIQNNIASNYSRSRSTNFYGHHKSICLELARHFDQMNYLNDDRSYSSLRPLNLYNKLGYLLQTVPIAGLSHDDYRLVLQSLISIFFKGSLKSSLEDGVALMLGTNIRIVEVVFIPGSDISEQFLFTANIEVTDEFSGNLLTLSSNLSHVFNLVKPAHVFIVQRFVWTDSFDFQAGCTLLWAIDSFGNPVYIDLPLPVGYENNPVYRVPQIAYDGYQAAETQSDTAICDRFKYKFDNSYEEDMRQDCSENLASIEVFTDNVSAQFSGAENYFYISRIPVLKDSTHVAAATDITVTIDGLEQPILSFDPLTGFVVLTSTPVYGSLIEVTYSYNEYFVYRVITFYLNSPDSVFGGGSTYFNVETGEEIEDEFIVDNTSYSGSMLVEKRTSLTIREIVGRIQIPEVTLHAHICDRGYNTISLGLNGEPYIGEAYPGSIEEDPEITNPDFPESFNRISDFKEPLILGQFVKTYSPESLLPDEIYYTYLGDTRYTLGAVSITNKLFKNHDTIRIDVVQTLDITAIKDNDVLVIDDLANEHYVLTLIVKKNSVPLVVVVDYEYNYDTNILQVLVPSDDVYEAFYTLYR